MKKIINIAYKNMWQGFSEDDYFFIPKVIENEIGYECNFTSINEADLVISSVYKDPHYDSEFDPNLTVNKNQKTIQVVAENWNALNTNEHDFAIGFDILEDKKYFRFPLWAWYTNYWNEDQYKITKIKNHILINHTDIYKKRDVSIIDRPLAACAFIGNFNSKDRLNFIQKLNKVMPVDIYGPSTTGWVENKKEIAKKYQFIVCFENSIYPGYHTEKLPEAYVSEAIPIYYSADTYGIDFNEKCMVNRIDFSSDEECIDFIYKMTDGEKQSMINQPMTNKKIEIKKIADYLKEIIDVF